MSVYFRGVGCRRVGIREIFGEVVGGGFAGDRTPGCIEQAAVAGDDVVERHRGRLDIASTVGVGTRVTVTLPTPASKPLS